MSYSITVDNKNWTPGPVGSQNPLHAVVKWVAGVADFYISTKTGLRLQITSNGQRFDWPTDPNWRGQRLKITRADGGQAPGNAPTQITIWFS
jgi:hypothetical protein